MAPSNSNLSPRGKSPSKLDTLTGDHTTSIIVAILFIVTLFAFVVLLCAIKDVKDSLVTGFISILTGLIGFFAGTRVSKK